MKNLFILIATALLLQGCGLETVPTQGSKTATNPSNFKSPAKKRKVEPETKDKDAPKEDGQKDKEEDPKRKLFSEFDSDDDSSDEERTAYNDDEPRGQQATRPEGERVHRETRESDKEESGDSQREAEQEQSKDEMEQEEQPRDEDNRKKDEQRPEFKTPLRHKRKLDDAGSSGKKIQWLRRFYTRFKGPSPNKKSKKTIIKPFLETNRLEQFKELEKNDLHIATNIIRKFFSSGKESEKVRYNYCVITALQFQKEIGIELSTKNAITLCKAKNLISNTKGATPLKQLIATDIKAYIKLHNFLKTQDMTVGAIEQCIALYKNLNDIVNENKAGIQILSEYAEYLKKPRHTIKSDEEILEFFTDALKASLVNIQLPNT